MKIKNSGTITSIQQKKIGEKIEKIIHIRLDLNTKADKDEEYNIYVIDTKNATLIPMDWDIKIANDFEVSLNKKYDFILTEVNDKDKIHVIGLTEYSEK